MARITSVDEFFGREPVDWLEFRWGQRSQVHMQLLMETDGHADTPVPLNPLRQLEALVEEIQVVVAEQPPSRGSPDGSVSLSAPQSYDPPRRSVLPIHILDRDTGQFAILTPALTADNPPFAADVVPAVMIWIRYEDPDGSTDVAPLGIFYRRGAEEPAS